MFSIQLSGSILAVVLSLAFYVRWRRSRNANPMGLPLPPGPRQHFLLGNLSDLPTGGYEWIKHKALSQSCDSDIVFLNVFGRHNLFINSFKATNDLLDKKGAIYSDRPRLPMVKELMGWDWNLVLMSYQEGFTVHRRIVQQNFQPSIVARSHRPVMLREVRVLLNSLLVKPNEFTHHLRRMAGAIIMMVTYGHQIGDDGDEYIDLAEQLRDFADRRAFRGWNVMVNVFPILKYVPAWLPGAQFKRDALFGKLLGIRMRNAPYTMVKERMAAGTAVPSLISSMIEESPSSGIDEEVIKNCGGVIYNAGADTTVAALTNFFLAMMTYPEVQSQAQRELDKIVGRSRLPQFEDRDQLPYVGRVLKEVLRWKVVAPLGVPHCTTESDEYRGRHIPPRTIVTSNIWAILHDEAVYPNPETFDPDRFLARADKPAEPDPSRVAFGFGRRICPGRFFADDSMWLALASILHLFNISKVMDAQGRDIEPEVHYGSGLVSMPSPFACTIKPRFIGAEELIMSAVE